MNSLARLPRSVPAATAARRRSPAEMCSRPYFSTMSSHWVPLPEAGAPAITIFFGPAATVMVTARREEEDAVALRALSARRCLAPVNWEAETVNAVADIVYLVV